MAKNLTEENRTESRMLTSRLAGFSARCRNGQAAPCTGSCPYGLDVRDFLKKVRRKSLRPAYNVLFDKLLFPQTLCGICPAACQNACAAELKGEAIDLPGIEQAVIRSASSKKARRFQAPSREEKIAVIGAGLSGISAAYTLGSLGYPVTVFEKEGMPGGSLKGIVPAEVFLPELESVIYQANIELLLNREIKDRDELASYSCVILATGKGGTDLGLMKDGKCFAWDGTFFAIGELTGASVFSSVEYGKKAGIAVDRYLKAGELPDAKDMPTTQDGDFKYTPPSSFMDPDAAAKEAGRCLLCDCTRCADVCELMRHYKKVPPRFEIDIPGTLNPVDQIRKRSATRLLMSCDDCRLCEDVCPEKVPTGEVLMQVRTAMANDRVLPAAFHDFWLRDMAFSCSEEAEVFIRPENGFLYFPGCLLGASDPEIVTGSYDLLKEYLPGLGLWLHCCGIPAKWAGETALLSEHINGIRKVWEGNGKPVFLTACPSCRRNLKEYLPEIETRSVYTVLAGHLDDFSTDILNGEDLAVFHPCSSRFDPEEQKSVKALAKACGAPLFELEEPADRDGCCGYGGHIFYTNPGLYDEISRKRADADGRPYLTYCANCRDVLADKGKDCSHILKVLVEKKRTFSPAATLSDRRENRKRLKAFFSGQDYKENEMKLEISEELIRSCDRQLILTSDIEDVIRHCEKENRFLLSEDGSCIGHRKSANVTCWVSWKKEGDLYTIQNVYSHRMSIEGDICHG